MPDAFPMIVVLALVFVVLILAVVALAVAVYAYERHRRAVLRRMEPPTVPPILVDDPYAPDPTALATLRHAHRFGSKDPDGIRTCACGDRYSDAIRRG